MPTSTDTSLSGDAPSQPTVLRRSASVPARRRMSMPLALQQRRSFSDFEKITHRPLAIARHPSQVFETWRSESRRLTTWTEDAIRRSLVKFRTRKSATRSSPRRRSSQPRVPSRTIKTVLNNGIDVFTSEKSLSGERLMAVLYCWFYSWIIGLYYSFSDDGHNRSFLRWMLATVMVTAGTLLLVALAVIVFFYANSFLFVLTSAALYFLGAVFGFLFIILGVLAVVNFN